jgi:hypothetical protein
MEAEEVDMVEVVGVFVEGAVPDVESVGVSDVVSLWDVEPQPTSIKNTMENNI